MTETKGVALALQRVGDQVWLKSLRYGEQGLQILMDVEGQLAEVSFVSVYGFRVLDEADLLEFWTECSLSNGWAYEISEGGWFALESSREGFLSGANAKPREFLVVSQNECVSVMCDDIHPTILWQK